MNIVYLIGNGFDLNLKMKTSYHDFCNYYTSLPRDNDADVVKRLKGKIVEDIENWSDFELKLGTFLDDNVDSKNAIDLYNHLRKYLPKFIETEEKNHNFDDTQKDIFCKYLSNPYAEAGLLPTDFNTINDFVSKVGHNDWYVKIITFNYTKSIERLLGTSIGENTQIGTNCFKHKVFLSAIEHIHGFTDERMVFGVNDVSQIANNKLREDPKVTNRYVKPESNKVARLEHDKKCQQWIKGANLVCLFGLSFGDSDKIWWNMMSNVLRDGKVIIFKYRKDIHGKIHFIDQAELENEVKDKFLSKTDLNEDSKNNVKKNIYVTFTTDMFKFDIHKKAIETNLSSV